MLIVADGEQRHSTEQQQQQVDKQTEIGACIFYMYFSCDDKIEKSSLVVWFLNFRPRESGKYKIQRSQRINNVKLTGQRRHEVGKILFQLMFFSWMTKASQIYPCILCHKLQER